MKLFAILAFFAISQVAEAQAATVPAPPIEIQLAAAASIKQAVGPSLMLRIEGNEAGFDVEVIAKSRVRGCPHNLIHAAPHGPDMSEVLPWHVARQHFPNRRLIPVCGRALFVEVDLISPELAPDGERFTSGMLSVTLKPSRPVP